MDTTDATIRATLRALLAIRNESGGEFAERLGMKRATWYSRMAGETDFSADEVARAARALGMPVQVFYNGLEIAS